MNNWKLFGIVGNPISQKGFQVKQLIIGGGVQMAFTQNHGTKYKTQKLLICSYLGTVSTYVDING